MCDIIEIYVVCPALCEPGTPYGQWIDATKSLDEILGEINAMLADSPTPGADVFNIRDKHNPTKYDILSGINDLEEIHEIALLVKKYGSLGAALLAEVTERNCNRAKQLMESGYLGQFQSITAFAEDYAKNVLKVNEAGLSYLDTEKLWCELRHSNHFMVKVDDSIHVFAPC